jgi:hypothetical protein
LKPHQKLAWAVFRRYGMVPTWPVGHYIAVGDVISRTDGGFHRETTLKSLVGSGESLAERQDAMVQKIKLSDGVVVDIAANAETVGGKAQIGFASKASFVIVIEGGAVTAYDELWAVRHRMLALHQAGLWDRSWQLVTSVRSADACTMLVSDQAGVRAEARLRPGQLAGDFLDALDVGSEVSWVTAGGLASIAEHCTPLHSVLQVVKRIGRKARTEDKVGIHAGAEVSEIDPDGAGSEFTVEEVGPEEAGLADQVTGPDREDS